jgi:hypothetical protein
VRIVLLTGAAAASVLAIGAPYALFHESHPTQRPQASDSSTTTTISLAEWNGADRPAAGSEVRSAAQQLFESFAGSVEERNALGVVRAHEGNEGMDSCMADAGHPEWDWSLARIYADPEDALGTNTWLSLPMARWRSHDLVAAKPFLEAESLMNAEESPEYSDAVSSCLASAESGAHHPYGDDASKLVESLESEWWADIESFAEGQLPDASEYAECVRAAQPEILSGMDAESLPFETEVAYAMSGASPPDSAIPANPSDSDLWSEPSWQAFLRLEDDFDQADWNCREDVYTTFIANLEPQIDAFAQAHADEIEAARQYWQGVSERTAELGYDGQVGSLEQ